MMTPLTRWQKIIAYSALTIVLLWTVFGILAIWLMITDPHG
jgi:hypothetical protein